MLEECSGVPTVDILFYKVLVKVTDNSHKELIFISLNNLK